MYRVRIVVFSGLLLALVGAFLIVQRRQAASVRDSLRIAHMQGVAAVMARMYLASGSFADAACDVDDPLTSCDVSLVNESFAGITDPGTFRYVVATAPDGEGFSFRFTLERAHGALAKGDHVLTEGGIE